MGVSKVMSNLALLLKSLKTIIVSSGLIIGMLFLLLFGLNIYINRNSVIYWEGKASELVLQKNERAKIVITRTQIIIKYKTGTGNSSTQGTDSHYIPPEGPGAIVVIPDNPNEKPIVKVKKLGACVRPGLVGIIGTGRPQAGIDMKFFYFNRYGTSVGLANKGPILTISRHLDDVPIGKNYTQNVEGFLGYQWDYKLKSKGLIGGIRINF